jgi:hypothetical protein
MTDCKSSPLTFPGLKSKKVQADFSGGHITSDAGLLLLREVDRELGLTHRVSAVLTENRRAASCRHTLEDLLRQRVYALATGYEDQNDHNSLRQDIALQTAVEREDELAGQSTLCRWENGATAHTARAVNAELVEQFIAGHKRPPRRLILDFDATDVELHGTQEGRFYHGYYDHYCYLPLYVTCGDHLLVAYLRPSGADPARHALAILALLVRRLRRQWPWVRIVFRADSGFCRPRIMRFCERHGVGYILGIARNSRLTKLAGWLATASRRQFEQSGRKARLFGETLYAARSWGRKRRVIIKAEHNSLGPNTRFVVTNLEGNPRQIYDRLYCARGDMENRIKEQQLDLFAARTSAHRWWANQFRLLLSALAYVLLSALRRRALAGTELSRAACGTIRLKLLKVGAVVVRNTRRILFRLPSSYPYEDLYRIAARRLGAA